MKRIICTSLFLMMVMFSDAFSPYENCLQEKKVKHAALIASVKPDRERSADIALQGLFEKKAVQALQKAGISNLSCYRKVLNDNIWIMIYFDYEGKDYLKAASDFESACSAVDNLNKHIEPHPYAKRRNTVWMQMEWISYIRGSLSKDETKNAYSMVTTLKPGKEMEYRILHQTVWPGVVDQMARGNKRNFSIFLAEIDKKLYEFFYVEYVGNNPEKDSEMDRTDPVNLRWWKCTDPCQEPLPGSEGIWSMMDDVQFTEAEKITQEAIEKWQNMRFGMFIHWGPVSLTGHEIGWSRGRQTPIKEYDRLYKKFNPAEFDADEWVKTAEDAGMKYMVITTKHHDGFCLWPSKYTDYHIGNTPFKRDVLKELARACRKHRIRFGTYYSVCDWYHPDYPKGSPAGKTDKPDPDMDSYIKYLRNQVTELIRNYGPLCTMWFDVPREVHANHGEPTIALVRKLQPDITINNRAYSGKNRNNIGDYSTPEQKIGGFNRARPWETCMTICRQWAWKPNDRMKSLEECIQILIRTVGGDGNLLLNVSPMPDGRIEPRQVQRLKEMGKWLKKYGDGIYGTRGGPFRPGKWGASTCQGNKIYLYLIEWPKERPVLLPAIDAKIKTVKTLSGGKAVVKQTDKNISVDLPADDRDNIATVIELRVDGKAFDITPEE